MRPRFLLFLSVLLLSAALASAGQTSTPADPGRAALAAIFAAPSSSGCADAKLPSFEPIPTPQTGKACGACSDSLCQGKQYGAYCKTQNGYTYTCQPAYYVCSPMDCECWTGGLP
jgi:hypothetical protein